MRAALLLSLIAVHAIRAQATIPIQLLGPITAASTLDIGLRARIRPTSDGRLLVDAPERRRVYLLDSTLALTATVRDSGVGTGSMIGSIIRLIPYAGDSSLLVDVESRSMAVLDERGRNIRAIAAPRSADLLNLLIAPAAIDPRGRLVYTLFGSLSKSAPDSFHLVRGNFDTRTVDTIGRVYAGREYLADFTVRQNAAGQDVHVASTVINPFYRNDEWVMTSGGSIAIVRVQDYHIDWIEPDGRTRTTPRMPLDWRAYTDSERKAIADSTRRAADSVDQRRMKSVSTPSGGRGSPPSSFQSRFETTLIPEADYPTYWPPIRNGSVIADLENQIWILPTTSMNAANGPTYDVIDAQGQIVKRMQLPKGRIVGGFAPGGAVYLLRIDGTHAFLERAMLQALK